VRPTTLGFQALHGPASESTSVASVESSTYYCFIPKFLPDAGASSRAYVPVSPQCVEGVFGRNTAGYVDDGVPDDDANSAQKKGDVSQLTMGL
jgi:hypothetical protein